MIQEQFALHVVAICKNDESIVGLAVGGSWLTKEVDEFSDLDLVLVTKEKIGGNKEKMLSYATRFGKLLTGFTGEHVGEPRLLICLYDEPLLHVDIKFVTLAEFSSRVEDPAILLDTNKQLEEAILKTAAHYPYPDYQWIEDRFWIWVHYASLKIGRGELLEAFDFFGFIRMVVLGPLLQVKNGLTPRGVRKVEQDLAATDLQSLLATMPVYERASLIASLENSISLYRELRKELFPSTVQLQIATEKKAEEYLFSVK